MPRINRPQPKPRDDSEKRRRRHEIVYNTKTWQEVRQAKLMLNPECEDCLKRGVHTIKGLQVHHIVSPFQIGLSEADIFYYAYNLDNLVTLCAECHQERHRNERH